MDNNLSYAHRNISIKESFNFVSSKRAICSVDILFNIFNIAINQNINKYMFIFAYQNKLYSIGYEKNKDITFMIGLPDSSTINFQDINELKNNEYILSMHDKITVIQELIQDSLNNYANVPLSSNPMLSDYLVDSSAPEYNLNINDEIANIFNNSSGTKLGIKNILIFIGGIILIIIIFALITYFIG